MQASISSVTHKSIVEKLKYEHKNIQLRALIEKELGTNASGAAIFNVKAEILRLAKKSTRPFRLDQVLSNPEGYTYTHANNEHYVDTVTLAELKKTLLLYKNVYTIGAEEHMYDFVKRNKDVVEHAQEMSDVHVTVIDVSEKTYRTEERMHLGVQGEAYLFQNDTDLTKNPKELIGLRDAFTRVQCVTQNVSESGLKIKLQTPPKIGQKCLIRYKGLEDEYHISQPYIAYECVAGEQVENARNEKKIYSWALRIIKNDYHKEFNIFIKRLIFSNRHRYKVDLENVERSVCNNIAEQFFANRQEDISIFLNIEGEPLWVYGGLLGYNTFNHFNTKLLGNTLYSSASKDNLFSINDGASELWAVINQGGKSVFSTVIQNNEQDIEYLKYVMQRKDGKVFIARRSKPDVNRAFLSHSLPTKSKASELADRRNKMADYYSDAVRETVSEINSIITLKEADIDILEKFIDPIKEPISESQHKYFTSLSLKKDKQTDKKPLYVVAQSCEFRKEDRFSILTGVKIETKIETLQGTTVDLSENGCQVKLNKDTLSLEGEIVTVNFESLEEVDGYIPTGRYKVVNHKGGAVRLLALENRNAFITAYFEKNYRTLEPVQNTNNPSTKMIGLERALRNLTNTVQVDIKAVMSFKNSTPIPTHVNLGPSANSVILGDCIEMHEHNQPAKEWMSHMALQKQVTKDFREINKDTPFCRHLVMVALNKKTKKIQFIRIFTKKEKNTPSVMGNMQRTLTNKGLELHWFQLDVTRKSRIFDLYYREELDYIDSMAKHRGALLHDMIKKTCGVMSWIPINPFVEKFIEFKNDNHIN
jgi:hypothetical protein